MKKTLNKSIFMITVFSAILIMFVGIFAPLTAVHADELKGSGTKNFGDDPVYLSEAEFEAKLYSPEAGTNLKGKYFLFVLGETGRYNGDLDNNHAGAATFRINLNESDCVFRNTSAGVAFYFPGNTPAYVYVNDTYADYQGYDCVYFPITDEEILDVISLQAENAALYVSDTPLLFGEYSVEPDEPSDPGQGTNEPSETPDEQQPFDFGTWLTTASEDISAWLGDVGIATTGSTVLIVGIAIIIVLLVRRSR